MPDFLTSTAHNASVDKQFFRRRKKTKPILKAMSFALMGGVLTLSGCATKPVYQTNANKTIQVNNRGVPSYYKVKPGDTVSQIASRYGLNYRQIGAINGLDSRYTIYAGQWLKLWESGHLPPNANRPVTTPVTNPNLPNTQLPNVAVDDGQLQTGYRYPTSNQVIRHFNLANGTQGMWFSGQRGDPVLASKAGQVLYAGNGLSEYGNLIMIQHDNTYITAYAHNDQLLVKERDNVKAGQRIATMGSTGQTNQVALEFQVRKNGSPIDPRAVLGF